MSKCTQLFRIISQIYKVIQIELEIKLLQIILITESMNLYPHALPPRINPQGYGRNMSLFLIMKKYECNLRSYLETNQTSWRSSLMILTQVLEALTHLSRHKVAHRDLKTDNILVQNTKEETI